MLHVKYFGAIGAWALRACRILIESAGDSEEAANQIHVGVQWEADSHGEALCEGCARAMRRVAAGASAHSVAAVLRVSVSSVVKWAPRQRRTGSVAPGKMGGHRPRRVSGDAGRAMEPTIEAAQDRLASVLDTIPPNACANYFSGAGYAAT